MMKKMEVFDDMVIFFEKYYEYNLKYPKESNNVDYSFGKLVKVLTSLKKGNLLNFLNL